MKKIVFIILVFLSCRLLPAPEFKTIPIIAADAINYYDPLIKALTHVEVGNGSDLYNELEGAVGYFQIRQVRVDDYNRRTKSNYKLKDFYDYRLSLKMFLYYTNGRSYEEVAKSWNGSGPMVIVYWEKVKSHL